GDRSQWGGELRVDGDQSGNGIGVEPGQADQAGQGAPRVSGGEPMRASAQANRGVELEQHVRGGQGELAAVEAVEGPGGAGGQQHTVIGVGACVGVGQRGGPVAVDHNRALVAGGVDLVVFAQPVVLVSGVVVDGWVLVDRDDIAGRGGVFADHRVVLGGQGGGGGGFAGAGHTFQH